MAISAYTRHATYYYFTTVSHTSVQTMQLSGEEDEKKINLCASPLAACEKENRY